MPDATALGVGASWPGSARPRPGRRRRCTEPWEPRRRRGRRPALRRAWREAAEATLPGRRDRPRATAGRRATGARRRRRVRRGRRRRRRRRRGHRPELAGTGCASVRCSTRPTTSATARPRPTPPSCTPVSTPRPARSKPASCARATTLLRAYAGRPASPSSASARCSSPGTRSSSPRCPPSPSKAAAQRLHATPGSSTPTSCAAANRTWARRAGRARSPRREHHLPLDDALAFATQAVRAGVRPAPELPGDRASARRRDAHDLTTSARPAAHPLPRQRRRAARRRARPAPSATTTSPSPRAAASSSSSTSSPATWSATSCCRCRRPSARACWWRRPCSATSCSAPPPRTSTTRPPPGPPPTGSTPAGEKGRRILPALLDEEVTAVYAGLRAATEHDDYRIQAHPEQRYVDRRRHPLHRADRLDGHRRARHRPARRPAWIPRPERAAMPGPRRRADLGEAFVRPYQSAAIAADPAYGTSSATASGSPRARSATRSTATVPATDLDGLRRRTRAGSGRCQQFFCAGGLAVTLRERQPPPAATPAARAALDRRGRHRRARARRAWPWPRPWPAEGPRSSCWTGSPSRAGSPAIAITAASALTSSSTPGPRLRPAPGRAGPGAGRDDPVRGQRDRVGGRAASLHRADRTGIDRGQSGGPGHGLSGTPEERPPRPRRPARRGHDHRPAPTAGGCGCSGRARGPWSSAPSTSATRRR